MREKFFIIPVFIPHAGCPHECIYCNQRTITGESVSLPGEENVRNTIERFLNLPVRKSRKKYFVAFYGGTFTALPGEKQLEFLDVAQDYVKRGLIEGIRFSTRPDYISEQELNFLSNFTVDTIELGAQSMDDTVLRASARGHTAEDTRTAANLVKNKGIKLGIQIMVGLPKETRESFLRTVDEVIKLGPDFVRVYPTLVLKDSLLAGLYNQGKYRALNLDEAVDLVLDAYVKFKRANIRVIRMGLQAEPWFEKKGTVLAGPYHPSFGELVISAYYYKIVSGALNSVGTEGEAVDVIVPRRLISQVKGHRGSNIVKWEKHFNLSGINVIARGDAGEEIIIKSGEREWKINCQG